MGFAQLASAQQHGLTDGLAAALGDIVLGPGQAGRDEWIDRWRVLPRTWCHQPHQTLVTRDSLEDRLSEIQLPALVLQGDADTAIPVGRAAGARFGGQLLPYSGRWTRGRSDPPAPLQRGASAASRRARMSRPEAPGYRLGETLREGSRSAVYRGVCLADGVRIVLKTAAADVPASWARLSNERAVLDSLKVTGVVRLRDETHLHDGRPALVLAGPGVFGVQPAWPPPAHHRHLP